MSQQQSGKRGKKSTAQKRASSRHDFEPIPATSKVDGAAGGNQPTGRKAVEVMEHYTEEEMRESAAARLKKTEHEATENKAPSVEQGE